MIKKWLAMMSLSIFLLTGLSTSSFFLPNLLTHAIKNNTHTASQLNFALSQENEAALHLAWQQAEQGSEAWQKLAKTLAKTNGKVAYLLANFYVGRKGSGGKAAYQQQAILWYQQAIRLNYSKASITLAELYFHQGNISGAQNLLSKLQVMEHSGNQGDDVSLAVIILAIKMAVSVGNIEFSKVLLNKFSLRLQADKTGILLLAMMEKYQVLSAVDNISTKRNTNSVMCPNSIQLFATNLVHLAQADQLVRHFTKQPLNDVICFSPVRYLPLSLLSCSSEQQSAILCDETKLYHVADSVATRYIAIMLPEGGANVHLGMLYFDAQDSVDVIEHEISHLLGFVDEYPLVEGHVKCRANQQQVFSQNIAVLQNSYEGDRSAIREHVLKQLAWAKQIKNSTPILHSKDAGSQKDKYWYLGTPDAFEQEIGLFRADTCDNNAAKTQIDFNAFKPLSGRTKLQYNELSFPTQYITLLHRNSEQFLMPSFHYNIALAYYQQNNIERANYWLKEAVRWENSDTRQKKVQQGDF